MMKRKLLSLLVIASVCLQGCISDYMPTGVKEISELLVVDGTITNGITEIKLSRSVGLTESIRKVKTIPDADVYVESEDGTYEKAGYHTVDGKYLIETGELNIAKSYRLHIRIGSEEYASGFLQPVITPELDSIFWQKKEPGEPVNVYVATHNSNTNSKFYRWSYEEHWEIRAQYFGMARYLNKLNLFAGVEIFDIQTPNNRYYCWGKDSSKVIILDSSEKLSENIISRKKLLEIPAADDKLSTLYYIKVKQNSLRKEAYNYLENIQKNIEQTGSIFTPIPSETKGNISCLSNPEMPVIGYIEVATTTEKDLYLPYTRHLYEPEISDCHQNIKIGDEWAVMYEIYEFYPPETTTYLPNKCVNCLSRPKASKARPEWWPNNHQ